MGVVEGKGGDLVKRLAWAIWQATVVVGVGAALALIPILLFSWLLSLGVPLPFLLVGGICLTLFLCIVWECYASG